MFHVEHSESVYIHWSLGMAKINWNIIESKSSTWNIT